MRDHSVAIRRGRMGDLCVCLLLLLLHGDGGGGGVGDMEGRDVALAVRHKALWVRCSCLRRGLRLDLGLGHGT